MEKDPTCKPATLLETLAVTTSDLYSNIFIRLYILITMPVATATAERSFSVMRRVKTHVNHAFNETFKSLGITCVHVQTVAYRHKVIESFALKKTRRMGFLVDKDN